MILPEQGEPIVVQGITGKFGSLHAGLMLQYGTNVAAGVTPGRKGEKVVGVPVYDKVAQAVAETGARCSIVFVPAPYFYSAVEEAILAGIKLVVAITEHVPIRDELKMIDLARAHDVTVVGPNTPGVILPSRKIKMGIMPAPSFKAGRVALFSRSGTLMYEIANQLTLGGLGQTIALGIGGDPVNGTTMIDWFDWVRTRNDIEGVVAVGEIGGDSEERLARYISETKFPKPIFSYVAGRAAPREKRMGHAGAIIYGDLGTADSKISAFRSAGVQVAMTPSEVATLVGRTLNR
ncbi:MAG: CoA-binding protein [Nitrososphaerota archaeon]|jgi:succinyl-CoA synthetase alpha subunit|nr:CoA-binding protein [Nitrososphaerota archaeon]